MIYLCSWNQVTRFQLCHFKIEVIPDNTELSLASLSSLNSLRSMSYCVAAGWGAREGGGRGTRGDGEEGGGGPMRGPELIM